jgi:hypothetical protein
VGIYRLFPHFVTWQTDTLGFPVAPFIYVVEAVLPMLVILLHRKKLADYGIHFHQLRYELDIAFSCFFPVALGWIPIALGADYKTWSGAILLLLR